MVCPKGEPDRHDRSYRKSVLTVVLFLLLTCLQILYFAGLAYFIFKMVRMYSPSHEGPYLPARKELTSFAVLTIISILLTITNACLCASNYKKGLKPYIYKSASIDEEEKPIGSAYAPYATEMSSGPA